MDEGDLSSNPFAALFPNISIAQCYVESHSTTMHKDEEDSIEMELGVAGLVEPPKDEEVQEVQELNKIITLNKFSVLGGDQKQLVYLSSLALKYGRFVTSSLFQALTTEPGWICQLLSRLCLRE